MKKYQLEVIKSRKHVKITFKTAEDCNNFFDSLLLVADDDYYSSREIYSLYKIDYATIHRWIKAGKIKNYGKGRNYLLKTTEIIKMLQEKKIKRYSDAITG